MGKLSSRKGTANESRGKDEPRVRPTAIDEVADALSGEVARCAARATEHALLLESIGAQSFDMSGQIFREARSTELLQV